MIAKIKRSTKSISVIIIYGYLVSNQEALSSHVVDHIKNLFSSLVATNIYLDIIKDSIPNLISQEVNQMLKKIPSDLEIKETVFNLNKDGALGLDGFRAFFVQRYWDIIHHDVIKAFNAKLHPPKAPDIIEVIWKHHVDVWLKCNTYGSFSTDMASCGGLFRKSLSDFLFDFLEKLDCPSSIHVELFGVIKVVDYS
ncbi:hypothetical protein KIW84_040408 [Lathyrus oleraceus]|uniref:Uncharacterized protein n=1 Tax=Pisum sativum TaxID=3888 RepID=A0A9D4X9X9_PEA|nr:hypothetical protein KIW84_040408 [Pisum sativum]